MSDPTLPQSATADVAQPQSATPEMVLPPSASATGYKDDDLVYVDPDQKKVIGKVEFAKNDKPKSLVYKPIVVAPSAAKPADAKGGKPDKKDRGQFWRKFYPFGTYRSMRKIYKLEGKIKEAEPNKTLEEVLPKALNEAFWTWEKRQETNGTQETKVTNDQ